MIQNWKHDFYWMHIPSTSPWSQKVIMSNHQKPRPCGFRILNTKPKIQKVNMGTMWLKLHFTCKWAKKHSKPTKKFHLSHGYRTLGRTLPQTTKQNNCSCYSGEERVGKVDRGIVLGVNIWYKKKICLRKVISKQEWCPCFNNQESLNKLQNRLTFRYSWISLRTKVARKPNTQCWT